MSPEVTAAWIAVGGVLATVIVQIIGVRSTKANTEQQIEATHQDTADTLAEQRTRTLNERFATAAEQLGSDRPAVRLPGVYAMARLADDWKENRQTCVDMLCAYLRMPYEPDPGQDAPEPQRLAFRTIHEVRHTAIRVITAHLRKDATESWQGLNFDFTGVVFDGGDFTDAQFSGGKVHFSKAEFSGGHVDFTRAQFSGSTVDFTDAQFSGGMVHFTGAQFSDGTVHFRGAKFPSGAVVVFYRANFSGGTVDFRTARFSGGKVDFSDPGDWSFPPIVPWADAPPPGVKLPREEDKPEA